MIPARSPVHACGGVGGAQGIEQLLPVADPRDQREDETRVQPRPHRRRRRPTRSRWHVRARRAPLRFSAIISAANRITTSPTINRRGAIQLTAEVPSRLAKLLC